MNDPPHRSTPCWSACTSSASIGISSWTIQGPARDGSSAASWRLSPWWPGVAQEPRKRVWMRPAGSMPEDPLIHSALLVFASDRMLVSTAARAHVFSEGRRMGASLDHALWLHRLPPRFDDWIVYFSESPVAHAARGLVHGAMYNREGARIASVVQEGLIRTRRG